MCINTQTVCPLPTASVVAIQVFCAYVPNTEKVYLLNNDPQSDTCTTEAGFFLLSQTLGDCGEVNLHIHNIQTQEYQLIDAHGNIHTPTYDTYNSFTHTVDGLQMGPPWCDPNLNYQAWTSYSTSWTLVHDSTCPPIYIYINPQLGFDCITDIDQIRLESFNNSCTVTNACLDISMTGDCSLMNYGVMNLEVDTTQLRCFVNPDLYSDNTRAIQLLFICLNCVYYILILNGCMIKAPYVLTVWSAWLMFFEIPVVASSRATIPMIWNSVVNSAVVIGYILMKALGLCCCTKNRRKWRFAEKGVTTNIFVALVSIATEGIMTLLLLSFYNYKNRQLISPS